ncbi:hypothetical protein BC829DRAFT_437463 [Chytridium lagenaria]|nr:hypothetical protein BC829DRAFT_437463 [Chytridium lagenaria]
MHLPSTPNSTPLFVNLSKRSSSSLKYYDTTTMIAVIAITLFSLFLFCYGHYYCVRWMRRWQNAKRETPSVGMVEADNSTPHIAPPVYTAYGYVVESSKEPPKNLPSK